MNHYLDNLVTDPIVVSIGIRPISENGSPWTCVTVNHQLLKHGILTHEITRTVEVSLLDSIEISIEMQDKSYSQQKETAIIIDSVCIDGFEIIPKYTHLAVYENEKHIAHPTSYLGYNGVWRFKIPEPFYRWRHRVTGQGWLLEPIF